MAVVTCAVVFWVMILCCAAVGYHHLGWRWWQCGPPKRWYPTTSLHSVIIQKTTRGKLVMVHKLYRKITNCLLHIH